MAAGGAVRDLGAARDAPHLVLMSRWRKALVRGLERAGARLGLDVVRDSIYSPIVRPPSADDPIWEARSALAGVRFDLDEQITLPSASPILIGNADWEVTLALATLALERRQRLAALLPSIDESPPGMPGFKPLPAAFWIRRVA